MQVTRMTALPSVAQFLGRAGFRNASSLRVGAALPTKGLRSQASLAGSGSETPPSSVTFKDAERTTKANFVDEMTGIKKNVKALDEQLSLADHQSIACHKLGEHMSMADRQRLVWGMEYVSSKHAA